MHLDYERIARELMRALRGARSQPAMSRRLGYRTNVAYAWESGRSAPTAAGFLHAAERTGHDVRAALSAFFHVVPPWLKDTPDVTSPAAVSELLTELRAGRPMVEFADAIGRSRFATARLLQGHTEPRLPDFLRLLQALTLRLLDFIAAFVDPSALPSIAPSFRRLEAARRIAFEEPFTHAVLRLIELELYRALPRHEPGFIAARLGISLADEERYLALLLESGQLEQRDGRYVAAEASTVDTRRDPRQTVALRRFWAKTVLERAGLRDDDVLSFNLFTVAEADVTRIRELHRRYFAELRALAGASEPAQALLLANVQLLRLA